MDDDAAPRRQQLPRPRDVAVPIQAAAKPGARKLGTIIRDVIRAEPWRQCLWLQRVVQETLARSEPTERGALRCIAGGREIDAPERGRYVSLQLGLGEARRLEILKV